MVTEASGVARPANACKPAQRYFLIPPVWAPSDPSGIIGGVSGPFTNWGHGMGGPPFWFRGLPVDQVRRYIAFLQEYSIPLILGVVAGLVWANIDFSSYHLAVEFDFWNFGQGSFPG